MFLKNLKKIPWKIMNEYIFQFRNRHYRSERHKNKVNYCKYICSKNKVSHLNDKCLYITVLTVSRKSRFILVFNPTFSFLSNQKRIPSFLGVFKNLQPQPTNLFSALSSYSFIFSNPLFFISKRAIGRGVQPFSSLFSSLAFSYLFLPGSIDTKKGDRTQKKVEGDRKLDLGKSATQNSHSFTISYPLKKIERKKVEKKRNPFLFSTLFESFFKKDNWKKKGLSACFATRSLSGRGRGSKSVKENEEKNRSKSWILRLKSLELVIKKYSFLFKSLNNQFSFKKIFTSRNKTFFALHQFSLLVQNFHYLNKKIKKALLLLFLEPYWESKRDRNDHRKTASSNFYDAIESTFQLYKKKYNFYLFLVEKFSTNQKIRLVRSFSQIVSKEKKIDYKQCMIKTNYPIVYLDLKMLKKNFVFKKLKRAIYFLPPHCFIIPKDVGLSTLLKGDFYSLPCTPKGVWVVSHAVHASQPLWGFYPLLPPLWGGKEREGLRSMAGKQPKGGGVRSRGKLEVAPTLLGVELATRPKELAKQGFYPLPCLASPLLTPFGGPGTGTGTREGVRSRGPKAGNKRQKTINNLFLNCLCESKEAFEFFYRIVSIEVYEKSLKLVDLYVELSTFSRLKSVKNKEATNQTNMISFWVIIFSFILKTVIKQNKAKKKDKNMSNKVFYSKFYYKKIKPIFSNYKSFILSCLNTLYFNNETRIVSFSLKNRHIFIYKNTFQVSSTIFSNIKFKKKNNIKLIRFNNQLLIFESRTSLFYKPFLSLIFVRKKLFLMFSKWLSFIYFFLDHKFVRPPFIKKSFFKLQLTNCLPFKKLDFLGFEMTSSTKKIFLNLKKSYLSCSKHKTRVHLKEISLMIKMSKAKTQEELIFKLAPKIRQWTGYYQNVSTKKLFNYCDYFILKMLWKWSCRRHPKKSKHWIKSKYFISLNNKNWIFAVFLKNKSYYLCLPYHKDVRLTAHIQGFENKFPYDGDLTYWCKRLPTNM